MVPRVAVNFYLDRPDLDSLRGLDPDRHWRSFQQGEEAWVLQTYLRLARAGDAVELTSAPRGAGIVVFHAKQKRALARHLGALSQAVLVAVRGDLRGSLAVADFEIVQNGGTADGRRRFFLPHWPQPGLVARDPNRGDRLSRLAYKGYLDNLHPAFRAPEWRTWLAARGIEWVCDAIRFEGAATPRDVLAWPDFHDLDAVLAVRPPGPSVRCKPATKLFNAWLAGTPALLGPEPAYRELRRAPLDFLEVDSIDSARAAVIRLQEESGLYRALVDRGRERAGEFTFQSTLERWRALLAETLPQRVGYALGGASPRPSLRRRWLRALRWIETRRLVATSRDA
jgi:hypothetical protein